MRKEIFNSAKNLLSGVRDYSITAKRTLLGTIVLTVVFLTIIPLVFLLWTSFWSGYPGQFDASFTMENFVAVYLEGFFDVPGLFLNSLTIAVGMTLTGMVIGLLFAWLLVRTNIPMKGSMELVLLSGNAIPGYVFGIMYVATYGPDNGIVSSILTDTVGIGMPFDIFSPWGIGFIAGINVVSTFYLLTVPAIQDMDSRLEEVSRVHGARISETIYSITLPLIKPAIYSATITVFLYGLGEFAVVSILGVRNGFDNYATKIGEAIKARFPAAYGEAAALALSLLLVTLVLVWYYRKVTQRKEDFMTLTGHGSQPHTWDLGRWRWPITGVLWVALLVIWVFPIVALVATSLQTTWTGQFDASRITLKHYVTALTDDQLRDAFTNSLIVAGGGATLGTILVVGMAYYTERTTSRFRGAVDFLSLTPLAVPGIIMGGGYIFTFLWIGNVVPLLNIYGTLLIIIIGCVVVFLPVSSRIAIGNIVQIHKELEEAARIAGASWLQQMRKVFLPLFQNTTVIIWFFLALHIFQLLSIPYMTYTSDTIVIPVELYQLYFYEPALALVSAISTIFIALTLVFIIGLRYFGITFYELGQH